MAFDTETSPAALVFATFFVIALIRNLIIYALGRYATTLATRGAASSGRTRLSSLARNVARLGQAGGIATVQRWGIAAVPMSFLAPGTKTVVNAAAGLLRLPWRRYLPALLLGVTIHATIYTTIGWAAWKLILGSIAGSPIAASTAIIAIIIGVALLVYRRRKLRRQVADAVAGADGLPGRPANPGDDPSDKLL